jgi:hypothetical protein
MTPHLRIARPVTDVERAANMYCQGLGLRILASFRNHDGFDGIMVGVPAAGYHLEFTRNRRHPVTPSPTGEDLLVLYYRSESEWQLACGGMNAAGFAAVSSFNPYWNLRGRSYQDPDGYRVVLQREAWASRPQRVVV